MSNHPKQLIHTGNGRIFNWTPQLAKRSDMKPYFGEGDGLKDDPIVIDVQAEVETAPTTSDTEDLSNLSWQQLKKKVESKGGQYTSRGDAIAFLSQVDETD